MTKTDPAVGAHCDFADVEHAEDVADPYRTLEDGSRPDVQDWLRSQGQKTRRFLDALPGRDRIERMLLSASSTTRWGTNTTCWQELLHRSARRCPAAGLDGG